MGEEHTGQPNDLLNIGSSQIDAICNDYELLYDTLNKYHGVHTRSKPAPKYVNTDADHKVDTTRQNSEMLGENDEVIRFK